LVFDTDGSYTAIALSNPEPSRLRAGITLKRAGDMRRASFSDRDVNRNRITLLDSLKGGRRRAYSCRQVHSQRVVVLREAEPEEIAGRKADGLLTNRPDAILTVTVADCLPIFIADPSRGVYGILHSGWKGTGIVGQAVRILQREYGCGASDVKVTLGPGIGSCCYEVEEARYHRFLRCFGPKSVRRRGDRFFLDLIGANLTLLEQLGVESVMACRDCTFCTSQLASYRRDGSGFVHMLAFIGVFDND